MNSKRSTPNRFEIPVGIIPRIESSQMHLEFVRNNQHIDWIMIDIHRAEALLNKGVTANDIGNDIKIITTTTVADEILAKYFLEKELEVVKKFQPDCHIPCDYPVYAKQPEKDRIWFLNTYIKELERFNNESKDLDIPLIPLIKGTNYNERKICYDCFDKLNINYAAYYAAQHFGKRGGNRIKELCNEIRGIVSESKLKYLMVIGLQSLNGIDRLPPQVIAAAGLKQWRTKSQLGMVPIEQACENYYRWKNEAESKLSCGLDVIREY